MIAAVYEGNRTLSIKNILKQPVKENEVCIKIDSATICGTDIHILQKKFEAAPPVVLGHEFSGHVVEKGRLVKNCLVGDLVAVEPHIYCGLCKYCRIGKPNLCSDRKAWGINMNGGFAQYVTCRMDTVYVVPEGISAEEAALAEMIGCCLNGIERIRIDVGDLVVILGGGAAGMVMAQLAQTRGAGSIIFSEPVEFKRKVLRLNGYDHVLNPDEDNILEYVRKVTHGLGADVVIEASGSIVAGQSATSLAGVNGRVLFFGVASPGKKIEIEPNMLFSKELTLKGSIRNPFTHYRVLKIMHKLDLQGIISHRFPLKDINNALELAASGQSLKICIKPNQ